MKGGEDVVSSLRFYKYKRTFLLLGILFLSSTLFLTACGGQIKESRGGPKEVVFYAVDSTPYTDLDPSVEFSNGIQVLNNIYETLLRYDPLEKKIIPVLATDYNRSEDGLTWTFHIRKGVKFHDGTELNAEAVKFSIERTMKLGKGASFIWDPVKEINVKDDYIVEFKLKYPAPLDLIASCPYAAFIMSPQAVKSHPEGWLTEGHEAGTGPYMLESFIPNEEVVLTKFNEYWKGWEGKHFDKVVIKSIPESATRRQMLEKGDIDITYKLPYEDVEALKNNPNLVISVNPSFENLLMLFNTQKAPLNNKLVRQALAYAFPYEDVVKYAAGGYAKQSIGPIPYGMWGHSDELFQYKFDLNKAKELLKEAGYPNGGFKLLLTYTSGDEAEKKAAELYKSALANLNIGLEIRGMPWESQWQLARDRDPNKRQDIFVFYWWPDVPSPYSWLFNMFHTQPEILFNLAYWENKEFDALIDQAQKISGTDISKAEKMFIEAQKILIEESPAIFVYDKEAVYVYNKTLKGFKYNPVYPTTVFFYDLYREK
ncbi:MAG: ABC transporter substrate-binding protein [Caldanaerobacter subterraneus]